jgi:YegS/Rv2252/BmrU family lipid kinase
MVKFSEMSTAGKFWIILNPTAGKGKAASQIPVIENFLKKQGETFEIIPTKGTGDAIEISRNLSLAQDDCTVAAGGDGTCNEVVNGLLARGDAVQPLLGILPIGRGNDFSSTPQIPTDCVKAMEVLIQRKIHSLDAGFVKGGFFTDGRYFVNGVGIGFDTKVGFDAANMKHVHSGFAYALGAIINIVRYDPSPVIQMKYDDNEITLPAAIVSIMNGRRMGGSFFMGPNALLDDGVLDICSIRRPRSRIRLMSIVARYTKGTQIFCKEAVTGRAVNIHLKALEGGMAAHCDGETICYDGKELTISCKPGALRLIGV